MTCYIWSTRHTTYNYPTIATVSDTGHTVTWFLVVLHHDVTSQPRCSKCILIRSCSDHVSMRHIRAIAEACLFLIGKRPINKHLVTVFAIHYFAVEEKSKLLTLRKDV